MKKTTIRDIEIQYNDEQANKIDYIDLTNESRVYTFERKKHI